MTSSIDHYIPPSSPGDTLKRVLVIKLGDLSGFIQTLGAMRVVRAAHPSARITLLTTPPFSAFAKACPYFDIVETDGRPLDGRARSELLKRLKADRYDMVYDFENDALTLSYFHALHSKSLLWSGATPGASHAHRNPHPESLNTYDRLQEQLAHAGLTPRGPNDPSGWDRTRGLLPHLDWIRPALRDPPRLRPEFFGLEPPYALLLPGSDRNEDGAIWSTDRYVELACWLADKGVTPAVLGGSAEAECGAAIARAEPRARNIVSRTDLFQVATLGERARLALGGENGFMHMVAAAGCPGVCLFAQVWDDDQRAQLGTIWHRNTRIARTAPRGSDIIMLYAAELDLIAVDDVKRTLSGVGLIG